jgi:hypothetical protein
LIASGEEALLKKLAYGDAAPLLSDEPGLPSNNGSAAAPAKNVLLFHVSMMFSPFVRIDHVAMQGHTTNPCTIGCIRNGVTTSVEITIVTSAFHLDLR